MRSRRTTFLHFVGGRYALFAVCVTLLLLATQIVCAGEPPTDYGSEHNNFGSRARIHEHVQQRLKNIPHDENSTPEDDLFYLFTMHDNNLDGHLDGHELIGVLSDFNGEDWRHNVGTKPTLTIEDIVKMIDHTLLEDDIDNDGRISWEEYLQSMKYKT